MIALFYWKYGECQGIRVSLLPDVSSSIHLTHKPDRIIPYLKNKDKRKHNPRFASHLSHNIGSPWSGRCHSKLTPACLFSSISHHSVLFIQQMFTMGL